MLNETVKLTVDFDSITQCSKSVCLNLSLYSTDVSLLYISRDCTIVSSFHPLLHQMPTQIAVDKFSLVAIETEKLV